MASVNPPRSAIELPAATEPLADDAWLALHAFSPEGVDRTLIVALLERTPEERLEAHEVALRGLDELRRAFTATARR